MLYNSYKYQETTLTASSYDRKISIEIPKDSTSYEVFEAFKTLFVGLTFTEEMFNDAVVNYYFEHELNKNDEETL